MDYTKLLASLITGDTDTAPDWSIIIEGLKGGTKPIDVKKWVEQYDVTQHDVMKESKRPSRALENGEVEGVNRVGLAFQQLITERAAAFLFGNPAKLTAKPDGEQETSVYDILQRILTAVKIDGHNMELALDLAKATEVAECWFAVEEKGPHTKYGFSTKFKLRVMRFSPWLGDDLYPLFDESQDLVAFSRAFVRQDADNKKVTYFETYTAEHTTLWSQQDGGMWTRVKQTKNPIGKIPIVYARQEKTEWADVQNLIERLETLLSNYADSVDYHASPTVVVEGAVESYAKKGEQGKVIQIKKDNKVYYLNLDQSPDMIKLEVENKYRLIHSLTQTPDISFESIKGIGDVSGIALKLLFLDAHLKAKKKILLIYNGLMTRRNSLILAFIALFDTRLADATGSLLVETKIEPLQIDNEEALIELLSTATGGLQLLSQETAVGLTGFVDDPAAETKRIETETAARQTVSITEPSTI